VGPRKVRAKLAAASGLGGAAASTIGDWLCRHGRRRAGAAAALSPTRSPCRRRGPQRCLAVDFKGLVPPPATGSAAIR